MTSYRLERNPVVVPPNPFREIQAAKPIITPTFRVIKKSKRVYYDNTNDNQHTIDLNFAPQDTTIPENTTTQDHNEKKRKKHKKKTKKQRIVLVSDSSFSSSSSSSEISDLDRRESHLQRKQKRKQRKLQQRQKKIKLSVVPNQNTTANSEATEIQVDIVSTKVKHEPETVAETQLSPLQIPTANAVEVTSTAAATTAAANESQSQAALLAPIVTPSPVRKRRKKRFSTNIFSASALEAELEGTQTESNAMPTTFDTLVRDDEIDSKSHQSTSQQQQQQQQNSNEAQTATNQNVNVDSPPAPRRSTRTRRYVISPTASSTTTTAASKATTAMKTPTQQTTTHRRRYIRSGSATNDTKPNSNLASPETTSKAIKVEIEVETLAPTKTDNESNADRQIESDSSSDSTATTSESSSDSSSSSDSESDTDLNAVHHSHEKTSSISNSKATLTTHEKTIKSSSSSSSSSSSDSDSDSSSSDVEDLQTDDNVDEFSGNDTEDASRMRAHLRKELDERWVRIECLEKLITSRKKQKELLRHSDTNRIELSYSPLASLQQQTRGRRFVSRVDQPIKTTAALETKSGSAAKENSEEEQTIVEERASSNNSKRANSASKTGTGTSTTSSSIEELLMNVDIDSTERLKSEESKDDSSTTESKSVARKQIDGKDQKQDMDGLNLNVNIDTIISWATNENDSSSTKETTAAATTTTITTEKDTRKQSKRRYYTDSKGSATEKTTTSEALKKTPETPANKTKSYSRKSRTPNSDRNDTKHKSKSKNKIAKEQIKELRDTMPNIESYIPLPFPTYVRPAFPPRRFKNYVPPASNKRYFDYYCGRIPTKASERKATTARSLSNSDSEPADKSGRPQKHVVQRLFKSPKRNTPRKRLSVARKSTTKARVPRRGYRLRQPIFESEGDDLVETTDDDSSHRARNSIGDYEYARIIDNYYNNGLSAAYEFAFGESEASSDSNASDGTYGQSNRQRRKRSRQSALTSAAAKQPAKRLRSKISCAPRGSTSTANANTEDGNRRRRVAYMSPKANSTTANKNASPGAFVVTATPTTKRKRISLTRANNDSQTTNNNNSNNKHQSTLSQLMRSQQRSKQQFLPASLFPAEETAASEVVVLISSPSSIGDPVSSDHEDQNNTKGLCKGIGGLQQTAAASAASAEKQTPNAATSSVQLLDKSLSDFLSISASLQSALKSTQQQQQQQQQQQPIAVTTATAAAAAAAVVPFEADHEFDLNVDIEKEIAKFDSIGSNSLDKSSTTATTTTDSLLCEVCNIRQASSANTRRCSSCEKTATTTATTEKGTANHRTSPPQRRRRRISANSAK